MWPALIGLLASLIGSWGGAKIANRVNRKNTIADKMSQMNDQNNPNAIKGIRGDWTSPKGGPVQMPLYDEFQQQGLQNLYNMGMEGLKNTPIDFGPIKEATMQDYRNNIIPELMERFSNSNQQSSGLFNALTEGSKGLETTLAGMQNDYNQNALNRYTNMITGSMTPMYENIYRAPQPTGLQTGAMKLLEYGLPAGGAVLGGWMGGRALGQAMKPKG